MTTGARSASPSAAPVALPDSSAATDIRAALDELLRSTELERSGRLQAFLSFIVERTLAGESELINESLIAAQVFGRPSYNAQDDSTVRRQAHALRSKLHSHYGRVGGAHLRIELPIGRYVPQFRRGDALIALPRQDRSDAPPPTRPEPFPAGAPGPPFPSSVMTPDRPEPLAAPPAPTPAQAPGPTRRRVVLAAAGVSVFGAGVLAGSRLLPGARDLSARVDPALERLWGGWLRAGAKVTLCVSTPPTLHVKPELPSPPHQVRGGLSVSPEQSELFREHFDLTTGGELRLHLKRSAMSKYGELMAAAQLAQLFGRAGMTTIVRQSQTVSVETFRAEDVVVLGNDENNPWLQQLLAGYPLQLLGPTTKDRRRIADTSAGGAAVSFSYPEPAPDGLVDVFGLVSHLPGLATGRRLMVVSGLGDTTTQLATEFLTDPVRGSELERALRSANGGALPSHYQAVVEMGVRGRSPVRGAVVLARPLRTTG